MLGPFTCLMLPPTAATLYIYYVIITQGPFERALGPGVWGYEGGGGLLLINYLHLLIHSV